jgi:hypothetical protein
MATYSRDKPAMSIKRFPWSWLIALLAGFGIGLAYAWVLAPARYVDAEPHILRHDFKDDFRSAIAAAYASNADLERARARLALLGDPDPYQALTAQAQRMMAAGEPAGSVQQVALLASALQGMQPVAAQPSPSEAAIPTINLEQASPVIITETSTAETPEPTTGTDVTATPAPGLTATPRPSRTPSPTLGAPYQLVGQDTVCDPELEEGLLQVVVINITRRQIPGAEIIITWNSGEEHIFTGLKPELGHGYADFVMTPGVAYSVRMADGGTPASELSAPDCRATGREAYTGGIRVTFQQP